MGVLARDGESFEGLLKRFKNTVAKDGIIGDFKRHQSFMSKSQKARMKIKKAERRAMIKSQRRPA